MQVLIGLAAAIPRTSSSAHHAAYFMFNYEDNMSSSNMDLEEIYVAEHVRLLCKYCVHKM